MSLVGQFGKRNARQDMALTKGGGDGAKIRGYGKFALAWIPGAIGAQSNILTVFVERYGGLRARQKAKVMIHTGEAQIDEAGQTTRILLIVTHLQQHAMSNSLTLGV